MHIRGRRACEFVKQVLGNFPRFTPAVHRAAGIAVAMSSQGSRGLATEHSVLICGTSTISAGVTLKFVEKKGGKGSPLTLPLASILVFFFLHRLHLASPFTTAPTCFSFLALMNGYLNLPRSRI